MCAMAAARDSPAAIGAIAHQAPELLLHDGAGVPLAALWRHTAIDAVASGLPQHAVALHLGGCTLVEKWCDGRLVGHRSHIGSVSLVPAQVTTQWVLGGCSRVAHLYVEPAQIARAAEASGRPDGIRDFFAERDEVLAALVRVALAAAAPGASDSLGLDQLRALVVRHLLQRYGIDGPAGAGAARGHADHRHAAPAVCVHRRAPWRRAAPGRAGRGGAAVGGPLPARLQGGRGADARTSTCSTAALPARRSCWPAARSRWRWWHAASASSAPATSARPSGGASAWRRAPGVHSAAADPPHNGASHRLLPATMPDFPVPRFDHFYRHAELTQLLADYASARPDLLSLRSIGKSFEGRDIWLATLTNTHTGADTDKPAFWVDGNIHAAELTASTACLYWLHHLVSHYGGSDEVGRQVTQLLDTRAVYIVPRLNPDGAELALADKPRHIRSGTRPYPFDEPQVDGLTVEDVDGDGRVLSMRIADPHGGWKKHPQQPRLLVPREPGDFGGEYFRVMPEGLLKNYDGLRSRPTPTARAWT